MDSFAAFLTRPGQISNKSKSECAKLRFPHHPPSSNNTDARDARSDTIADASTSCMHFFAGPVSRLPMPLGKTSPRAQTT